MVCTIFRVTRLAVLAILAVAMLSCTGWRAARGDDTPGPSARAIAEGYLRRSREWGKAACEMAKEHNCRTPEAYFAACEAAWDAIYTCPEAADVFGQAAIEYAANLDGFLSSAAEFDRHDPDIGIMVGPPQKRFVVPIVGRGLAVDSSAIEEVVAAPPPSDKRISRCHLRSGFGLPVSVRIRRPCGSDVESFMPPRQSVAATAVLRFSRPPAKPRAIDAVPGPIARDPAPAILDLVNPVEARGVNVGCVWQGLAADFTAPLLDMLEAMPPQGVAGFLQSTSVAVAGGSGRPMLQFLEPYQPGKIPVVFIHGLASDEGTWFDMLNELRTQPSFHRCYQPWVLNYPTGSSFLRVSLVMRRQLREAREKLDPDRRDPALDRMVLVGHSMGGLHAKLQVIRPGDGLWNAVATRPIDSVRVPDEWRRDFIEQFYFEPLPSVRRVVYIATPHGGASLASRAAGRAASMLVRRPPEAEAIHRQIIEANPGLATPEFARRVPTTIDVLEPSSPFLAVMRAITPSCGVNTHSIIGDVHESLATGPGDCIVPVSSARERGVASEIFVPATHTKVHHHPIAVAELSRILEEHASGR